MFFYASLFVASFIVAMIILWLYRSLVDIGKVIYRAILPSSKTNVTEHVEEESLPMTVNEARTPWGWGGHSSPATEARTHAALPEEKSAEVQAVPWGWPGNTHKTPEYRVKDGIPLQPVARTPLVSDKEESKAEENPAKRIGWPYREDQFEFAGDTYHVTQKVNPRKTNLQKTVKPWGW